MSIDPRDLSVCTDMIRHGSLSFHAASRLLPSHVRNPALALYAFCRLADDEVDLKTEKAAAVLRLSERLDKVYAGTPENAAPDRAFAAVVEDYDMPRALPEALLEGLAWDALGRQYATLSDLYGYSARVASAVGVMMSVLMRVRDADALARACDLGVAMQLTNIARDVGEDAAEGRLYLPTQWFAELGHEPERFLANPTPNDAVRTMTKRLVMDANRLYFRSEPGIAKLPLSARPGIYAARHIYAGIGKQVKRARYDSLSSRAHTSRMQKIGWLGQSMLRAAVSLVTPDSAVLYARPLPEVAFLVDAAARRQSDTTSRIDGLVGALARLAETDRERQASLLRTTARGN